MVHKFTHTFAEDVSYSLFKKFVEDQSAANDVKVVSFNETEKENSDIFEFELDGENANIEKVVHQINEHFKNE